MAATWVSNSGAGIICASCQQISMSWRAAWNTLTTPLVGQQVEQRAKLDVGGQRVDHDRLVDARHLQHAELGVIGALAQEFGVDRHEWMPRKAGAGLGQCFCICDRLHSGG